MLLPAKWRRRSSVNDQALPLSHAPRTSPELEVAKTLRHGVMLELSRGLASSLGVRSDFLSVQKIVWRLKAAARVEESFDPEPWQCVETW